MLLHSSTLSNALFFFSPRRHQYHKVAATAASGTQVIAIVNPNNGPQYGNDTWKKASYDACIALLQQNKVEVVGYIHTKTNFPHIDGYRDISDVKHDIDLWKTDYDVDGIFIDEVSNRWPNATFDSKHIAIANYTRIVDYVLETQGRAIMNPGGAYYEELMAPYYGNSKVISVVFESPVEHYLPAVKGETCLEQLYTSSQGSFAPGPWCPFVPNWDAVEPLQTAMESTAGIAPEQSAVMIYDKVNPTITAADTKEMITIGLDHHVGWYYVNDSVNQWAATPSDEIWEAQSAQLRCD